MDFTKIHQKNINGLTFFGEVLPKSLNSFQENLDNLFESAEDLPLENFEQQIFEDKGKLTRLVKMPDRYIQMNFKSSFYKAVLQEDIDCDNVADIESIRYYEDFDGNYIVQFIVVLK